MATNKEYLKPDDPSRQHVYPDEMIRADGTVRNPEYQRDSGLAWIWAGVAIAALAIVAFTFFGNDTRHEIPPSAVTSVVPETVPPPAANPATVPPRADANSNASNALTPPATGTNSEPPPSNR